MTPEARAARAELRVMRLRREGAVCSSCARLRACRYSSAQQLVHHCFHRVCADYDAAPGTSSLYKMTDRDMLQSLLGYTEDDLRVLVRASYGQRLTRLLLEGCRLVGVSLMQQFLHSRYPWARWYLAQIATLVRSLRKAPDPVARIKVLIVASNLRSMRERRDRVVWV